MQQKVIVDTHFRRMDETFSPQDLARLYAIADVQWGKDEPMPLEAIEAVKSETVAVIAANWRHGDVRTFPHLRAILEVSGRFPDADTLDYAACFTQGIRVLSCAPAFAPAVAEMALVLTLALCREIPSGDAAIRAGTEHYYADGTTQTTRLFDQPVGFIGFGNIARALKPLLAPFRCPICVYDPWLTDSYLQTQDVIPVDLDTLLNTSQIVFVLAAPTEANAGLINRERLERMKPGTLLILVSRAHLVDFAALTELLYAGHLRAAIDVFPEEPIPADHPIRQAPNTVLSAHRAGADAHGCQFIGKMIVNDLEAILQGLAPQQMQAAQPEMILQRGLVRK